jgi:hypothetical protein
MRMTAGLLFTLLWCASAFAQIPGGGGGGGGGGGNPATVLPVTDGGPCGSAVSSCVLKASPGNFFGVYANCTSACWLMVFNANALPGCSGPAVCPVNGATTAGKASGNLVDCIPVAAGGANSITYPTYPIALSVGITVAISLTSCATLTLSAVGFIHGTVQ